MSKRIRKACGKFNLRVLFKSGSILHSLISKVKDPSGVVYQIPCQCVKVYIGEAQRRLELRVKEHRDAVGMHATRDTHESLP